jgi:hypothetical protein
MEQQLIAGALQHTEGNITAAAAALGIDRQWAGAVPLPEIYRSSHSRLGPRRDFLDPFRNRYGAHIHFS